MKEERKPGRPQRKVNTDLKQALLRAAIDLFAEHGYEGVSLSEIAEEIGADKGLTRYYFGSKDALWIAAMTHLGENFSQDLSKANAFEGGSQTDALRALIHAFVVVSAQWPQMSRVIVHDGGKSSERGDFIKEQFVTPAYRAMKELIEGAKSEGSLPDVSSRTIFFMITHGGSFPMALPALTNAIEGGNISSKDALTAHANAITELLLKSPKK